MTTAGMTVVMIVVAHAMTAEAHVTTAAVTAVMTVVPQEMIAEAHATTTEAEEGLSVRDRLKREQRTSMTTTMLLISMSQRSLMTKSSRLS